MTLDELNELKKSTIRDYLETGNPVIIWADQQEMDQIIDFVWENGVPFNLGMDTERGESLLQVCAWLNFRLIKEPSEHTEPNEHVRSDDFK